MKSFKENWVLYTGFLMSVIIIAQFIAWPMLSRLEHIEEQVNNHIPTQIRELRNELKDDIREMKDNIREVKTGIREVNRKIDAILLMMAENKKAEK